MKRIWPAAALLGICIGFFRKFTLTNQYRGMDHPDAAWQGLPWMQFQASELHSGQAT